MRLASFAIHRDVNFNPRGQWHFGPPPPVTTRATRTGFSLVDGLQGHRRLVIDCRYCLRLLSAPRPPSRTDARPFCAAVETPPPLVLTRDFGFSPTGFHQTERGFHTHATGARGIHTYTHTRTLVDSWRPRRLRRGAPPPAVDAAVRPVPPTRHALLAWPLPRRSLLRSGASTSPAARAAAAGLSTRMASPRRS